MSTQPTDLVKRRTLAVPDAKKRPEVDIYPQIFLLNKSRLTTGFESQVLKSEIISILNSSQSVDPETADDLAERLVDAESLKDFSHSGSFKKRLSREVQKATDYFETCDDDNFCEQYNVITDATCEGLNALRACIVTYSRDSGTLKSIRGGSGVPQINDSGETISPEELWGSHLGKLFLTSFGCRCTGPTIIRLPIRQRRGARSSRKRLRVPGAGPSSSFEDGGAASPVSSVSPGGGGGGSPLGRGRRRRQRERYNVFEFDHLAVDEQGDGITKWADFFWNRGIRCGIILPCVTHGPFASFLAAEFSDRMICIGRQDLADLNTLVKLSENVIRAQQQSQMAAFYRHSISGELTVTGALRAMLDNILNLDTFDMGLMYDVGQNAEPAAAKKPHQSVHGSGGHSEAGTETCGAGSETAHKFTLIAYSGIESEACLKMFMDPPGLVPSAICRRRVPRTKIHRGPLIFPGAAQGIVDAEGLKAFVAFPVVCSAGLIAYVVVGTHINSGFGSNTLSAVETYIRGCIPILERIRAHRKLLAQFELHRNVSTLIHEGIVLESLRTGLVIEVNRFACNLFGLERGDLIGVSLESVLKPATTEGQSELADFGLDGSPFIAALSSGGSVSNDATGKTGSGRSEQRSSSSSSSSSSSTAPSAIPAKSKTMRIQKSDGSKLTIKVVSAIIESGGEEIRVSNLSDVSDGQLAESALKLSTAFYHDLFRHLRSGFILGEVVLNDSGFPVDWIVRETNHYHNRYLKHLNKSQIINHGVQEIYKTYKEQLHHAGIHLDLQFWIDTGWKVAYGQPAVQFLRKELGVWVEGYVYSHRRGHFAIVYNDVTKRKAAEDSLQEGKNLLKVTFDSIEDLLIILDQDGKFVRSNRAAAMSLGVDSASSQLIGRPVEDLLNLYSAGTKQEKSPVAIRPLLVGAIESGKPTKLDSMTIELPKDHASMLAKDVPVNLEIVPLDNAMGAVLVCKDISQQHAVRLAQMESKQKSSFLAHMSHELRTPLHVLVGTLELLRGLEPTKDQLEKIDIMGTASNQLLERISDILDLSRLSSQEFNLKLEVFNVRAKLTELLKSMRSVAGKVGVMLFSDFGSDLPKTLIGDWKRVCQVLTNLMDNAIKFTSTSATKEIYFEVDVISRTDLNTTIRFSVRDSGIGIEPESLDSVFKEFWRSSSSQTFDGTGLGLPISRRLAHYMSGDVIAFSKGPKQGSTFTFTVPFVLAGSSYMPKTSSFAAPRSSSAGAGAAAAAEQGGKKNPAADLGSNPCAEDASVNPNPSVCSGGTAAGSSSGDSDAGGAAEMPPASLATQTSVVGGEKITKKTAAPDGLHILVAEDNEMNQRLIYQQLTRLKKDGIRIKEIRIVGNGSDAARAALIDDFDLIFMDCQMPVLDGYQATEQIREELRQRNEGADGGGPVIVALTADAMRENCERCFNSGMNGFVTKPLSLSDLRNICLERFNF